METFDLHSTSTILFRYIVPVTQFLLVLIFNIIVVIISYIGYRELKSKGWLLIVMYGFINIFTHMPSFFSVYAVRYLNYAKYGKLLHGYNVFSMLLKAVAAILFVVGLFLLLKEYLVLVKKQKEVND